MDKKQIAIYFTSGVEKLGLHLSTLQLNQLEIYLAELIRWNNKINLTGLREPRDIIIKNFLDSLTPLCFLSPDKNSNWIDIGSGAGFPGLPLKIAAPALNMTLVEPNQKKVAFLHHMIGVLNLDNVSVRNERIGQLAKNNREKSYELLLTRALSQKEVIAKGTSLVREGGQLLFFQAKTTKKGWEGILKHYPLIELSRIESLLLPFSKDPRTLVFLRVLKKGDTKHPEKD